RDCSSACRGAVSFSPLLLPRSFPRTIEADLNPRARRSKPMKRLAWVAPLFCLLPAAGDERSPPTPARLEAIAQASDHPSQAALEALWKALIDNYPVTEYVGAHGDEWINEFRAKVAAAPDEYTAFSMMHELVCRFNDYHNSFS